MTKPMLIGVLLLVSCHGAKQEVQENTQTGARPVAAQQNEGSLAYKRRMALLEYSRGGQWRSISTGATGDPALVATDPRGTRMLVLRWPTGYDVYQVDPGCKPVHGVAINQGRGAAQDDLPPLENSVKPKFDVSSEIRRLCDTPVGAEERHMGFDDAIRSLRTMGHPSTKTKMPTSLPKMTDVERAQAAEAMKNYRKTHPDWKPVVK